MTINNIQKQLKTLEINLIRKDIGFYDRLMELTLKKESTGILIFGMIPYISLFTIESYTYIKKVLPHYLRLNLTHILKKYCLIICAIYLKIMKK